SLVVLPRSTINFDEENISQLVLMNVGKLPILFKFQTNNVDIFCCKPVIGRILPNRQIPIIILLKWWKIDENIDRKFVNRFRLLSCDDMRSLSTHNEIDKYWRIRERVGLSPNRSKDIVHYMDVTINWEYFLEYKRNANKRCVVSTQNTGSTRKYSRDYSLSEIDVQLDTMS
uniref:Major sperm protein n=1 Tax=Parascaris univalens TaxID=6257 RepID=A0A914ZEZ0_PARUN